MILKEYTTPSGDYGQLLYQPKWGTKKFQDIGMIILGVSFTIVGPLLIIIMIILVDISDDIRFLIGHIGGLVFVFSGLFFLIIEFKRMPFRVYEKGITDISVPFWQGFHRQEVFIHKDRIIKIFQDNYGFLGNNTTYVIQYSQNSGYNKLYLSPWVVDNVNLAVHALRYIRPEAFVESDTNSS